MHLIYPHIKPFKVQLEISLKSICKVIFFAPFQYISSVLSNLVHTNLHTQLSTSRGLPEGLFSAATPRVILVMMKYMGHSWNILTQNTRILFIMYWVLSWVKKGVTRDETFPASPCAPLTPPFSTVVI